MAKRKQKQINKKEELGTYQYKMSKLMGQKILRTRKNKEDAQTYLCDYVNSTFGLIRPVTKVILSD